MRKQYLTASLSLTADVYNVIADLSALAGKEIIGVVVTEIQSAGSKNFYANIYVEGMQLRAIVSISQYYVFNVSVLYKFEFN